MKFFFHFFSHTHFIILFTFFCKCRRVFKNISLWRKILLRNFRINWVYYLQSHYTHTNRPDSKYPTISLTDLDRDDYFSVNFDHFWSNDYFLGICIENWLDLKPQIANSACLKWWNTLYYGSHSTHKKPDYSHNI